MASDGGWTSTGSAGSTSAGESSTGEPQFDGPGCGEPPPCDRGTFDGHARIESAADLARFAGYTEVTGTLEIMNSEDLVCLDTLACLEVVGRDVRIQDNAALRSTQGLSALAEIGHEHSSEATSSGDIIIAHNLVLERLAGFSVSELHRYLIVVENPALRTVSGLQQLRVLRGLHATSNPRLESLAGLRDIEGLQGCYVSFNDDLCSSEVVEVCGDLDVAPRGAAVYNHAECPDVPDRLLVDHHESVGCSPFADDCPPGRKCMPSSSDGTGSLDSLACRPVVDDPAAPGEVCSVLGGEAQGLDTCGRYSFCRNEECVAMCLGDDASTACLSPEARCQGNGDHTLFLCEL